MNHTPAQRIRICCHNTDLVHVNEHDRIILVIFSQWLYKAPWMMDFLWSETRWSTFKYFIILIVSTYYILCISGIIKFLIIVDARFKHEDSSVICLWNVHWLCTSYVVDFTDLRYYFRAIKWISLKRVVIILEGTVETGVCLPMRGVCIYIYIYSFFFYFLCSFLVQGTTTPTHCGRKQSLFHDRGRPSVNVISHFFSTVK